MKLFRKKMGAFVIAVALLVSDIGLMSPWQAQAEEIYHITEDGFIINSVGILVGYQGKGREITIPSDVRYISTQCFEWNNTLTKVIIPESVKYIGDRSFGCCDNLQQVCFLGSVNEMGTDVFADCPNLTHIALPSGVTTIKESTFRCCDKLLSVDIPASVTCIEGTLDDDQVEELGESPFFVCRSLKDIYFEGSQEAWEQIGAETPEGVTVHFNSTPLRFLDVPRGGWKEKAVRYMLDHHLMKGMKPTTFRPDGKMTRGQLVAVLWNIAGKPKVTGNVAFTDVLTTNTFYKAILWAGQNKVVNGFSTGEFKPNDPLTREQLAGIFANFARFCHMEIANKADISSFKDVTAVSKAMTSAVQWAVGNKIISGKSGGTLLDPKGEATRIEVAAMVMNYCKKILGM